MSIARYLLNVCDEDDGLSMSCFVVTTRADEMGQDARGGFGDEEGKLRLLCASRPFLSLSLCLFLLVVSFTKQLFAR